MRHTTTVGPHSTPVWVICASPGTQGTVRGRHATWVATQVCQPSRCPGSRRGLRGVMCARRARWRVARGWQAEWHRLPGRQVGGPGAGTRPPQPPATLRLGEAPHRRLEIQRCRNTAESPPLVILTASDMPSGGSQCGRPHKAFDVDQGSNSEMCRGERGERVRGRLLLICDARHSPTSVPAGPCAIDVGYKRHALTSAWVQGRLRPRTSRKVSSCYHVGESPPHLGCRCLSGPRSSSFGGSLRPPVQKRGRCCAVQAGWPLVHCSPWC